MERGKRMFYSTQVRGIYSGVPGLHTDSDWSCGWERPSPLFCRVLIFLRFLNGFFCAQEHVWRVCVLAPSPEKPSGLMVSLFLRSSTLILPYHPLRWIHDSLDLTQDGDKIDGFMTEYITTAYLKYFLTLCYYIILFRLSVCFQYILFRCFRAGFRRKNIFVSVSVMLQKV